MTTTGLAGTLRLARVAGRRDRLTLPAWIVGLTLFQAAVIHMSVTNLPTHDDLLRETRILATTPALRIMGAPVGVSAGQYAMVRGWLTIAVLAGVMSILAVVRHTRQDEELGRTELVASGGAGRYAPLAAAVIVVTLADVVLALGLAGVLVLAGQPAAGSLAAGVSVGLVGMVMAGAAAVTSQVAMTARGAISWASAALAVAFGWQAAGNVLGQVSPDQLTVSSSWPVWLSPLGWGQQLLPYAGERWWPTLLLLASAVVLVAVAALLVGRRDFGHGLLRPRLGPARARRSLLSPSGLTWRLQRSAYAGWLVAMIAFGILFGGLSKQIEGLGGHGRDWYVQVGGSDNLLDAFAASMVEFAGMTVAAYAVQTLLRLRTDETNGLVEPLLSTGTSRLRWLAGYLATTAVGACSLLLVFAAVMGLVEGATIGDVGAQWRSLIPAALTQLAAVCLVAGVVVVLMSVLPRWAAPLSWTLLLAAFVLGPFLAPSVGAPDWATRLSPFTHLPRLPATEVTWGSLAALTLVGVLLVAFGGWVLRERDLRVGA